jgi:hypothetical protein
MAGRWHVEVTERRTYKDWAHFIKGMLEERYPEAIKPVWLSSPRCGLNRLAPLTLRAEVAPSAESGEPLHQPDFCQASRTPHRAVPCAVFHGGHPLEALERPAEALGTGKA